MGSTAMNRECEYAYHLICDTEEPFPPFSCADPAHERWMGQWLCPLHLDKLMEAKIVSVSESVGHRAVRPAHEPARVLLELQRRRPLSHRLPRARQLA